MLRALLALVLSVMSLTFIDFGASAANRVPSPQMAVTPEYVTVNHRLMQRFDADDFYLTALPAEEQHQVLCIALNMYHEARNSSVDDQLMTGFVVLNRTGDGRWRPSACEVVWQRSSRGAQFSWTKDGKSDMPREPAAWDRAKVLAFLVWSGLTDDISADRTHYHAIKIAKKPSWASKATDKLEVGKHVYMKV